MSTSDVSLESIEDLENLFWMVAFKVISADKNILKVSNIVKNIVDILIDLKVQRESLQEHLWKRRP